LRRSLVPLPSFEIPPSVQSSVAENYPPVTPRFLSQSSELQKSRSGNQVTKMIANGAKSLAREIARHLIAHEAMGHTSGPAAVEVCEKLRRPLITLAGTDGFRALLARALTLARREDSTLTVVSVRDDGSLEGLTADISRSACALLIAELLGLLMTFVGTELTMRLLQDIWPEVPRAHLESTRDPA
jgi:hypothetical protein